jgi:Winged helix-turn helix
VPVGPEARKLSDQQLAEVTAALVKGPRANGFASAGGGGDRDGDRVRYSQTQTWTMLREWLGWSRQRPARRAIEHDDAAIATWLKQDLAAHIKARGAAASGSSSKMKAVLPTPPVTAPGPKGRTRYCGIGSVGPSCRCPGANILDSPHVTSVAPDTKAEKPRRTRTRQCSSLLPRDRPLIRLGQGSVQTLTSRSASTLNGWAKRPTGFRDDLRSDTTPARTAFIDHPASIRREACPCLFVQVRAACRR